MNKIINTYNKGFIFSVILCITLFASCRKSIEPEEVETDNIYFSSLEKKPLNALSFDTCYLLLQPTNTELLVGSVSRMIKDGDRFYFLDGRYRYVIAYDSLGRSIGRVGAVGKGHLEYLRCHDIAVDNRGNIYLSDGTSDKYIKFNHKLEAIEEFAANPEGSDIIITNNDNLLVGISPWIDGKEKGKSVALLDSQLNLLETYGSIGTYDENVAFGGTGFTNSGQYISYISQYEIRDDIMLFSPIDGKLVKRIFFDFGNQSVPDKFKSDIENNMNDIEKCIRLQDIFSVTDERVVGRISIDGKIKPFVLDIAENIIYIGDEINLKEECIAFINNSFVNLRQIAQEHYPDSVKRHIENNQTVLEFNKIH